ncbi:MAG: trypsin-like peptidase domain-containing protein [Byssovorax sp.]
MPIRYLSQETIFEILGAMTDAGMVNNSTLDTLLAGIDVHYATSLPDSGRPIDRVLMTLDRLDTTGQLADGAVPLVTWLKNASARALGQREPQNILNQAVARVSALASGTASGPEIKAKLPQKSERIVLQNDLLPFRFLQRGAEKGASVARVTVTRFDGGDGRPGDGRPRRSIGTGWLLTRDLLITNHHVVNARSTGEPDASLPDLTAQALGIDVGFDFDAPEAAITSVKIKALEAFSPASGPLDYAILRLASPVARTPLTIATTAMILAADATVYPSVNIIQHPEGRPKEVACRNNTIFRAEGVDLWYFTDTMAGSSGSPVFDDSWKVVALHKKWDFVNNVTYQGKDTAWANVGTQIFAILEDLTRTGKDALRAEIVKPESTS